MLNIPERLFILSIDDQRGSVVASAQTSLPYGLAGGMLAELALANKIRFEGSRLVPVDTTPGGDALFDDLLASISAEKKPRKLTRWVASIGNKKPARQVAERLASQNVIQIEKKHFLWVIPYELYSQVDASAKYWVKQHLRSILLAGEKAETQDVVLLGLLKGCRLLNLVFTKDERKLAGKKMDALVESEVFGESVAEVLNEIDAATMAAVTAAMASSS
jgi:hypothetical protein